MMASIKQRGYNLVEMAIALAVLGLLVGGALVPLNAKYRIEKRQDVENLLQKSQAAVIAYALRNRTITREVSYFDGLSYELPGGRPYLPCPDIDHDGREDRVAITLTVVNAVAGDMVNFGGCEQQKGILPWKTLGIEPYDTWGRRLTYRVDSAFSSELLGFDERTRADIFDTRLSLNIDPVTNSRFYQLRATLNDVGAVVCSAINNATASAPGCPLLGAALDINDSLIAGVVSSVAMTVGARRIPEHTGVGGDYGVVEGLPFVIVSHGKNGYGGVSRNDKCLIPPTGFSDANPEEAANSFYATGHPLEDCFVDGTDLTNSTLNESWFALTPETDGDNGSDDIVLWTSTNQLLGHMLEGGVLPVLPLVFLATEDI